MNKLLILCIFAQKANVEKIKELRRFSKKYLENKVFCSKIKF